MGPFVPSGDTEKQHNQSTVQVPENYRVESVTRKFNPTSGGTAYSIVFTTDEMENSLA